MKKLLTFFALALAIVMLPVAFAGCKKTKGEQGNKTDELAGKTFWNIELDANYKPSFSNSSVAIKFADGNKAYLLKNTSIYEGSYDYAKKTAVINVGTVAHNIAFSIEDDVITISDTAKLFKLVADNTQLSEVESYNISNGIYETLGIYYNNRNNLESLTAEDHTDIPLFYNGKIYLGDSKISYVTFGSIVVVSSIRDRLDRVEKIDYLKYLWLAPSTNENELELRYFDQDHELTLVYAKSNYSLNRDMVLTASAIDINNESVNQAFVLNIKTDGTVKLTINATQTINGIWAGTEHTKVIVLESADVLNGFFEIKETVDDERFETDIYDVDEIHITWQKH